ncbi:MAG: serine/threonine-protein kinase [Nannocystales bacterium]
MGVVFAAYDPELDRRGALKLLRERTGDSERNARMVREARATARLAHPNVVVVLDVGEFEGNVFMAMELVVGGTLGQWLAAAERSRDAILDVFLEAGEGLVAAHAAGLVHRDFKPANVLMGEDERARVTDFGIARAGETADTLTHQDFVTLAFKRNELGKSRIGGVGLAGGVRGRCGAGLGAGCGLGLSLGERRRRGGKRTPPAQCCQSGKTGRRTRSTARPRRHPRPPAALLAHRRHRFDPGRCVARPRAGGRGLGDGVPELG